MYEVPKHSGSILTVASVCFWKIGLPFGNITYNMWPVSISDVGFTF